MPPKVNHEKLMESLGRVQAMGTETPAEKWLWLNAPPVPLDQWGAPLPLSAMDQDALDRLVAILRSPQERGEALIHSGQLAADERDAIMLVYPEIYATLTEHTKRDLLDNPPPWPAWVESTVETLWMKPASVVYNPGSEKEATPPTGQVKAPEGTPADRREIAVRERR
jgi:hypothetical protein